MIKQCIGEFHFLTACEDKEPRINSPDSLYGEIVLSDHLFADLWQCVRTPDQLRSLSFDVFGEAMQRMQSYSRLEYNWIVPSEPLRPVNLHIASFSYCVAHKNETAAMS